MRMELVPNLAQEQIATAAGEPGSGPVAWLFRRLAANQLARTERQLRVMETLHLGGRRQLVLVSCGDERFLVGTRADGIDTITRVSGPAIAKQSGHEADETCD